MYINLNIKIYIPKIIERIGIAITLWFRKKRYGYTFRRIKLTKGKYAIVDVEDFETLNQFKWRAKPDKYTFYAECKISGYRILTHRLIMKPTGNLVIDHINHNGLDNRRANLRLATRAENRKNTRKPVKCCSSQYKGVSWHKRSCKWTAYIGHNDRFIHLGNFKNEIDAARSYDEAAKKYHGEFAVLNFATENTKILKSRRF